MSADADLTLYYYPGMASLAPHMVLRETGAPFRLALVDTAAKAHKQADYLKLNPNGLVPALADGDTVLFESAAICLYLCDRFPDAALAPEPGSRARGQFYKWLVHLTNTVQPEFRSYYYPQDRATDESAWPGIKATAEANLGRLFGRIETQIDGDYLLGDRFSAADIYLTMMVRWGRVLSDPPRDRPKLAALAGRVLERPAIQAVLAEEGLKAPFI